MKTLEKWRNITSYQGHNFSGLYEVSNWGNLRNAITKKPLATYSNKRGQGYLKTKIIDLNGQRIAIYVHRLVAYNFLPDATPGQEINHKDGNPHNNSWTNLEWATHKENIKHFWNNLHASEAEQ